MAEVLVLFRWIKRTTGEVVYQEVIAESLAYRLVGSGTRLHLAERWIYRVESVPVLVLKVGAERGATVKTHENYCARCGWWRLVATASFLCSDCYLAVHPVRGWWLRLRGKIGGRERVRCR